MEWSIPDTTYSEYYETLHGQIEYWLLYVLLGQRRRIYGFPPFWFGALNSMILYLEHVSYSPFIDHPKYGHPKAELDWDMRDVPEGQEDLIDENYLPKADLITRTTRYI